jgi:hypothetical protein
LNAGLARRAALPKERVWCFRARAEMSPMLDLLHRCRWRAECVFKQRGSFRTIVWLTERSDGHREWFETGCDAPPEVSDAAALAALADETREDFVRAGTIAFAVAYAATVHTLAGRVRAVAIEAQQRPPGRFAGNCPPQWPRPRAWRLDAHVRRHLSLCRVAHMRGRVTVGVTFDPQRGYIARHPRLPSPLGTLSLRELRRRVAARLTGRNIAIWLVLDKSATQERARRQRW